ncbi:tyrosine-type DNA invertase [Klebsiella michiganensis]|uniref:tyrosine-type DNA invertase n=1 Tax=Klebsiella michiganensis TaxID=1134687 RepID=UPI00117B5672|nr:tyrosine-type DNA invertase [Klebsiella michiganensis]TRW30532.1 tyrosine-type recombinase/integrase [Klebsiella michiganensis]TRW33753.1 tyrosine-type recombinase/integrase [Klebsiella michiganensis]
MSRRRYLSEPEIKELLAMTESTKNACRDKCMLMMCFIHGLRVSELINLKLSDIDNETARIQIARLKGGFSTVHPLQEQELAALLAWLKVRSGYLGAESPWLFLSLHGNRISRQQVFNIMRGYGYKAGLPVIVHPHMLRHACGYALAEKGIDTRLIQDYLGHRNIQHTVLYTASNAARFEKIIF